MPGKGQTRVRRTAFALVVGVLMAVGIAGCKAAIATPAREADGSSSTAKTYAMQIVRFAAVGDSLIAGKSPGALLTSPPTAVSWPYFLDQQAEFFYAGGWAQADATSTTQAENVSSVDCDVLVIESGTNNFAAGIGFAQASTDLDLIVRRVGPPEVLLLALPPLESVASSDAIAVTNKQLASLAYSRGWWFIDPWKDYRAGSSWAEEASLDGTHPTLAIQEEVAAVIGRSLTAIASAEQ